MVRRFDGQAPAWRRIGQSLAIAMGYFLIGSYALMEVSLNQGEIAGYWWPQGFVAALAIKLSWWVLPGAVLGEVATGLIYGHGPVWMAVGVGVSQGLQAAVVCWLAPKLMQGKDIFASLSNMWGFFIAVFVGAIVHTLIGGWLIYCLAEQPSLTLNWLFGGLGAAIMLAPLILSWFSPLRHEWRQDLRGRHFIPLLLLTILGSFFLHYQFLQGLRGLPVSFYLCIIIWAAFQLSPPSATLIIVLLAELAIWKPPSVWQFTNKNAQPLEILTQLTLISSILGGVMLTILVINRDRQRLTQMLQTLNQKLVQQVERKTTELDQAQAEIAKTALSLTEAIPMGTYTMVLPPDGDMAHFSFMSEQFLQICGLDREAALADPLNAFNCLHPDDFPVWIEINAKTFAEKIPFCEEARVVANGELRWIRAESVPRPLADGSTVWEGVLTDITDVKLYEAKLEAANQTLQASLLEKEILLKEIHHRVKNNLLVISSLLNWQGEGIQDPQLLRVFEDSQRRLNTMALIHEKLYGSPNLERIDLGEYIASLAQQLMVSSQRTGETIHLRTELMSIPVNVETATPCGLIVNELIANVLEHAFPPHRTDLCYLFLGLHLGEGDDAGLITLTIEDNGVGFPEGFDYQQTESLGWQLILLLTDQLDGELHLLQEDTTRIVLSFRELNYRNRI
ncbi:MAG: histidine kinase dimerization/phosphoacceptor domain -containing protein [Synechocystis sp.]